MTVIDRETNRLERDYWRDEVAAVLALEDEGVKCPSTFDGGRYLLEVVTNWRKCAFHLRVRK